MPSKLRQDICSVCDSLAQVVDAGEVPICSICATELFVAHVEHYDPSRLLLVLEGLLHDIREQREVTPHIPQGE